MAGMLYEPPVRMRLDCARRKDAVRARPLVPSPPSRVGETLENELWWRMTGGPAFKAAPPAA